MKKATLLGICCAVMCTAKAYSQKLYIDGLECLRDVKTNIYYASASTTDGSQQIKATLYLANYADSLTIDNVKYANGDTIRVTAQKAQHEVVVNNGEKADTLQLVLTNLPLISIQQETEQEFSLNYEVPTTFTLYDPQQRTNGQRVFTTKSNTSLRGATAANLDKKSFKLKFVDDQFKEENDVNLLGIRNTDTFILDGAAIDYSRIRNRLCFDLWNECSTLRDGDMMRNGTKGHFVEMMLNGAYHGIYCLTDKINRSLLGLKKTQGEGDAAVVRGVLYKCKAGTMPTVYLGKPTEPWVDEEEGRWYSWYLKYPDEIDDDRSWNALYQLLEHTNEVGASADSVSYTMSNLYENNVVEYAVFAMSVKLLDNMMHNTYLSVKNCTKNLQCWITPWDMDGSFGRSGTANVFNQAANSKDVFQDCNPFRFYYDNQVNPFYKLFCEKWEELHEGVLSHEHVCNLIDQYTQQLEEAGAWQRERNRWYGINNFWLNRPIELAESLTEETAYMKWWYGDNEKKLTDELTLITPLTTSSQPNTNIIYSIAGQRLSEQSLNELPHGIYIVNGKKVVK